MGIADPPLYHCSSRKVRTTLKLSVYSSCPAFNHIYVDITDTRHRHDHPIYIPHIQYAPFQLVVYVSLWNLLTHKGVFLIFLQVDNVDLFHSLVFCCMTMI